ncbi:hypothetical protein [Maritalea porphyrae]|uniref:hypothetical protein n=1 Tax=Maritalea porphyrae TaxID=880732 RepID=UPI0022AFD140|nr:hypothetical protein [Maritalea porphyrae]MCZ4270734.1 hypothetical protein [Maritalea porphyrae]
MLSFDQAYEMHQQAMDARDIAGAALAKYQKGPLGLTPEGVKFSAPYRKDLAAWNKAFKQVRVANAYLLKHYKSKFNQRQREERDARRMAKLGASA